MPRLAGSYDLTSDPRVDMQIAQSIGGAIGSGLRNHRIRQEEARKQHLNATLVQTLGRTIKDGVTDPGKILEAIESVPDYAESEWYQQMVMAEAQRRMGTTSKYGVMPGTYQHLTPEEQRKASLISAGIEPRVGDPMTAVIEGYNAIQNTDLPPELKQQLFNRNLGQLWLQAVGGPYRTPGFDTQPKGLPFGVSPEQYAAANRAEIERKIKGSSGGRRVIDFWDKDGKKHKKLINDDNFNDVIQSIIESGGRLEEDSLTKELSYWQTSLQKTLDPLGDVLPGQEETAALANERISILRNMIRGKSLPAEQPQLQGDMTEQQADTALIEPLDRATQAVDRATQAVERSKQVIEIGKQFPIKPFIDKIPETVKVGKLDKVKSVQAIQDAMVEYANVLVQQYGLTDFEAQREAERQVRLLQEKEPSRSRSPFKGWRTLPEGEIYYPQDRAGSPSAVGQPVGEAGAMTDILGETGQRPAQAQAQPPAQQQEPRPITVKTKEEYDSLPSGTVFIAPDGSRRKKPFSEAGAMTDMIARDRSQVDARQIAGDYFSLMTDILGHTAGGTAQSAAQPQQPVTVKTKEEYDNLPSGTLYIAPDGSRRRKR